MSNQRSLHEDNSANSLRQDPLGWIAADCDRLRQGLTRIEALIAAADLSESSFATLSEWLRCDIPNHYRYEAADLFPFLELRERKGDDFRGVIGALTANHQLGTTLIRNILPQIEDVRSAPKDARLSPSVSKLAALERQHLSLINAVILPIARVRLTREDLDALGQALIDARSEDL